MAIIEIKKTEDDTKAEVDFSNTKEVHFVVVYNTRTGWFLLDHETTMCKFTEGVVYNYAPEEWESDDGQGLYEPLANELEIHLNKVNHPAANETAADRQQMMIRTLSKYLEEANSKVQELQASTELLVEKLTALQNGGK